MLALYRLPELYLAVFPKAGWQSVRQCLKQHRIPEVGPDEVARSTTPLHALLRHPHRRLESAWRYFSPHGLFGSKGAHVPAHAPWAVFVDRVLEGASDPHWDPQLARLPRPADVIHPFEQIGEVWGTICEHPLPHLNASTTPRPVNADYRREEVEERYRDDLTAWMAARGTG